jgi:2-amino-4-hydroxy-6-hydroxymethyldihydropteridine diphosphokinase
VAVDDLVSDDPQLTLPHPRAADRAFVLVPWLAIDPDASLGGRPVHELAARLDGDGVRRRPDLVVA